MLTNTQLPDVGEEHTLRLNLQPHQGLSLLVTPEGHANTVIGGAENHQEVRRLQL
jgi:hypothetical protein